MKIDIAICEDTDIQRSEIEQIIRTWFRADNRNIRHQLHSFSNANGLLAQLEARNAFHDLFILDISLSNSIDGYELAQRIRQMHKMAELVFISVNDRTYQRSHELSAFDYLIKPISEKDIAKMLVHITTRKELYSEENISIRDRSADSQGWRGVFPISCIAYIMRINVANFSSSAVCINGDLRLCINGSLADFQKFNDSCFVRPSNECLLNMLYIEKILSSSVLMRDGALFEVTASFRESFQKSLHDFSTKYSRFTPRNLADLR